MLHKYEFAVQLLNEGLSPQEIAEKMNLSARSVYSHLNNAVRNGLILRCDIVLSIDRGLRDEVDATIGRMKKRKWKNEDSIDFIDNVVLPTQPQSFAKLVNPQIKRVFLNLKRRRKDAEYWDVREYVLYRDPRPDLFVLLCRCERFLHSLCRSKLKEKWTDADDWWKKGVPLQVRQECVKKREEDEKPSDVFEYTNFIDLAKIIDKNWDIFVMVFPKTMSSNRKSLISEIEKINVLRNRVMHPVKSLPEVEDAFLHVKHFLARASEVFPAIVRAE